eukprot:EG_transcript_10278
MPRGVVLFVILLFGSFAAAALLLQSGRVTPTLKSLDATQRPRAAGAVGAATGDVAQPLNPARRAAASALTDAAHQSKPPVNATVPALKPPPLPSPSPSPSPAPEPVPAALRAVDLLANNWTGQEHAPFNEECEEVGGRVILSATDAAAIAAYRAPRPLHVAIAIGGGLRTFKTAWPSALRHIVHHNPDAVFHVFVATNEDHRRDCQDCHPTLSCEQQLREVYGDLLQGHRCIPPAGLRLRGTIAGDSTASHHFLLFSLIRESFKLVVQSGNHYDFSLRVRPDSWFFGSLRLLRLPSGNLGTALNLKYDDVAPASFAPRPPRMRHMIAFALRRGDIVAPWFVSCPDARPTHNDPFGSMDDQFFFGPSAAMHSMANMTESWFDHAWRRSSQRAVTWAVATEGLLYTFAVGAGLRPCTVAGMPLRPHTTIHCVLRGRQSPGGQLAGFEPYRPN